MLVLKNITKDYITGDTTVSALKGIDIEFRKNEFVSVLGPSGCGKTTLLNIVGGLDRYTDGDLFINGRSTKDFDDSDWDSYRNHSIGFVFQNYNLIPHQTVLSNVELALTLSGVSKSERRKKAKAVLEKVGLGDQLNKKPNQMSGGQMQRVAIARALVNDPDILLADEPTGALDSETSVQIMDILKEIAKDRLVIMVTHNPDLANEYSTRIIRLLDGRIIDDSNPYKEEQIEAPVKLTQKEKKKARKKNKTSMSFWTAFSLSINNLLTKKTRTILTAFAGSIGIIGIALIMSVSNGVQNYINYVQRDTLASYPITLQSETVDMAALMDTLMEMSNEDDSLDHDLDKVYVNSILFDMVSTLSSTEVNKNDLEAFKKYIENNPEFVEYATAIQYLYRYKMNIYTTDVAGKVVKSDVMEFLESMFQSTDPSTSMMVNMSNVNLWEQMLPGDNGELINPIIKDQYNIVAGAWPQAYDEVVLVINERNELSDLVLYSLGLITEEQMQEIYKEMYKPNPVLPEFGPWDYESFIWKEGDEPFFKMILATEFYSKQSDGTYINTSENETGLSILYNDPNVGIPLKISGIIKPDENASSKMLTGKLCYTSALTNKVIELSNESDILKEQLANPDKDIITGLPFKPVDYVEQDYTDKEKADIIRSMIANLQPSQKAEAYRFIMLVPPVAERDAYVANMMQSLDNEMKNNILVQVLSAQEGMNAELALKYINTVLDKDPAKKDEIVVGVLTMQYTEQYAAGIKPTLDALDDAAIIAMFDQMPYGDSDYAALYDEYMPDTYSESTYDENLYLLGHVSKDKPSTIKLFADTFENKDKLAALITAYNDSVDEELKIEYTDYVALLMSSITTIINAISYVLIAFVAISLVVSSIMIGIITYISVLERTKEIGVLRSIGASKRDISRVFNAETLIVGFTAGIIGIAITLLLTLPINAILFALTEIEQLRAILPWVGGISLIVISMLLTLIAGIIPSRLAAKKDPVVALRSE